MEKNYLAVTAVEPREMEWTRELALSPPISGPDRADEGESTGRQGVGDPFPGDAKFPV